MNMNSKNFVVIAQRMLRAQAYDIT